MVYDINVIAATTTVGFPDNKSVTSVLAENLRQSGGRSKLSQIDISLDGTAAQSQTIDRFGLAEAAGMVIDSLDAYKAAVVQRLDLFDALGCRFSDVGLEQAVYEPAAAGVAAARADFTTPSPTLTSSTIESSLRTLGRSQSGCGGLRTVRVAAPAVVV